MDTVSGEAVPRTRVPRPVVVVVVGHADPVNRPGASPRVSGSACPVTFSDDALAVEQLGQPAVPEREAGAGDHRQVQVLGGRDDALVEHPPGLVGQRLQHPGAYVGRGRARSRRPAPRRSRPPPGRRRSPARRRCPCPTATSSSQVRRDVEPVRERAVQRLAVVQRDGGTDQRQQEERRHRGDPGERAVGDRAAGVPSSTIRPTSPMKRPSSRLTMNDGLSLTRMLVFFSALPVANAVASVASSVALAVDDLEQRHHRDRVEEVEADDPLGVLEVGGHLGDRQRGGVGGQHALGRDHGLDVGEDLLLDLHLLEDRLDDEVGVGEGRRSCRRCRRPGALSRLALSGETRPLPSSLSTSAWT